MRILVRLQMILLLCGNALSLAAQTPPAPPSTDELVVRGAIPHCKRLADDPADAVPPPKSGPYVAMVPDAVGSGFHIVPTAKNGFPQDMTPPGVWVRVGDAIGDFLFRAPHDGTPFCIGAGTKWPKGTVQLKHDSPGKDYACKYLRFSLFVASRKASGNIWLNGGDHGGTSRYNMFASVPIPDKMAWTPVMLQVGPVDLWSHWVGYGVALAKGDVWFAQPKFEVIPNSELTRDHRREANECEQGIRQKRIQEDDRSKL